MATKVISGDFGQNLPASKRQGDNSGTCSSMGGSTDIGSPSFSASKLKDRWIFTREQLENSASTKDGIPPEKQLQYRQQAANLIQDMGQRLPVNQLTINTAIVYMHRFYMFRSFKQFSKYVMAPTSLFLAAKVEEQPRKLEHVIKVCHACLHQDKPHIDVYSESYLKRAAEITQNELILLETLGFEISIDHPHTYVVKCTQLVKASRELSQMAYFMATNSLHLTTFCLLYKPAIVSAMCIHLSCKWSNYEIPLSSDGKPYWSYIDSSITETLLEQIITEFLNILKRYPNKLVKLRNYKPGGRSTKGGATPTTSSPKYPPSKHSQNPQKASSGNPQSSNHPGPPHERKPPQVPQPASEPKKPGMSLAEYKQREKVKPTQPPPKSHHTSEQNRPQPPLKPEASSGWPTVHPSTKPGWGHSQIDPNKHKINNGKPHNHHHRPPPSQDKTNSSGKYLPNVPLKPEDKKIPHKPPGNPWNLESTENLLENKIKQQMSTSNQPKHVIPNVVANKDGSVNPVTHKQQQKDHHRARHSLPANMNSATIHQHEGKPTSEKPVTKHKPNISTEPMTTKKLQEYSVKHPDWLMKKLKEKSQITKLTEEEKHVYAKLVKGIEARKKERKEHERRKKLQQEKAHNTSVDSAQAAGGGPSSGNLTVRLKIPAAVRAHGTASSGSASDVSPSHKSRKRSHGHDPNASNDPVVAKQSRKSESHHRSGSEHRHSKHKHRSKHHHSSKNNPAITEDVFQKALADAINNQSSSGGSGPTVTVKRTMANGVPSDADHYKNNKKDRFDPSAPVSATLPDNLFDEDQSTANHHGNDSQLSTPETGEIRDDNDDDDWSNAYSTNNNSSVAKQQERIPPITIKSSQIQ